MANTSIQSVGDHILIQFVEEEEQIHGGVIIPDSAKEKPQQAKVIALGSGRKGKDGKVSPFEVTVGTTVLVSKYAGAKVRLDDKEYTFVSEDEILGLIS